MKELATLCVSFDSYSTKIRIRPLSSYDVLLIKFALKSQSSLLTLRPLRHFRCIRISLT